MSQVPSNSEVRGLMLEMFGECVDKWNMDQLRVSVGTVTLNSFIHYPDNVIPLLLWLQSQRE